MTLSERLQAILDHVKAIQDKPNDKEQLLQSASMIRAQAGFIIEDNKL